MRLTAVGALALASSASAQNVVQYDLRKGLPGVRVGTPPTGFLSRRDADVASIANNITGGGYYIDVEVGTPGQPITMVLDTGSSDAWVLSSTADLCNSKSLQNKYQDSCNPTFDPNKSSTYKRKIKGGFQITYVDQTGASGDYITDNFKIAGVTVKDLQMGLATKVVRGVGVLGVGFSSHEAAAVQYPNIIDELASQGFIKSKAFSLYLNDRRSSSGNILFGGVDTDKFIGQLHILPIPKQPTGYTHYGVAMSGLEATFSNGTSSSIPIPGGAIGAILDSGTTLSYVPDSIASVLADDLGVFTDYEDTGFSFIDCDYLTSEPDFTLTFGFGTGSASGGDKFSISVPVFELVLDVLGGSEYLIPRNIPFDNVCLFGIQSTGGLSEGTNDTSASDVTLLGDTFLRSAYVVYDQDHHQIGMAQANLNSTETKIQELTSAGSSLPSVTGVASQQTTGKPSTTTTTSSSSQSSGPGSSSGGGGGQTTGTSTSTPKPNAAPAVKGGGAEVFAVMAAAGLCSLFGGALFLL